MSQRSAPGTSDSLHLVLSPSGLSRQGSLSPVVQPAAEVSLLARDVEAEADPEVLEVGLFRWKWKQQNFRFQATFIACD